MEHCTNLQFSADLVTFTEEILDGKFLFLCTVNELAVSQEEREDVYFKVIVTQKFGVTAMFLRSLKQVF